ncbi:ChaN family lipoprotein [Raoultella terrigena]|uniref:ChaN family lipoprotein n=1 Tax=Raoultella terrigena TaxID=577 RepID=UPI000F4B9A0B|nr:ChaN family lipoprotein [Raoultella terrigena]ROS04144.1 putative iron-regulated protein [Raoultella terrigena]
MFNMECLLKSLVVSGALALTACHGASSTTSAPATTPVQDCTCIVETASGSTLTPAQLIARIRSAPIVIVGEEHTNVRHHQIEQWLLKNLAQSRPQGSVLLEMIDISQQEVVNRVKQAGAAGTPVSATRAAETMRWNSGWPWDLYRDLVMTALEGPWPLMAANISRQQVKELYQRPAFPSGERSSRPQVHEALSAIIFLMHDGQISGEQVTAMMAIQQNRDRFMAKQLIQAPRPALLIAGGYHAAKDVGVPLHLADLGAEKPLVVMLTTDGTTLTAKQADYIWPVPAAK